VVSFCWPPSYKPTWRHVRTKRFAKDPSAFELTVFRTIYSGALKDNMDYSARFADADCGMHLPDIFVFKPLYHHGMRASPRSSPPWRSPTRPCASPGS
jgi:hypothetical protein